MTAQAAALRSPPVSLPDLLDTLRRLDLVRSVARLRDLLDATAGSGEFGD